MDEKFIVRVDEKTKISSYLKELKINEEKMNKDLLDKIENGDFIYKLDEKEDKDVGVIKYNSKDINGVKERLVDIVEDMTYEFLNEILDLIVDEYDFEGIVEETNKLLNLLKNKKVDIELSIDKRNLKGLIYDIIGILDNFRE